MSFGGWWKRKSGLAKAVVILSTVLSLAAVSCGLDWVFGLGYFLSPTSNIVSVAGGVQAVVLVVSLVGLIIVLAVKPFRENTRKDSND